ncbi:DNA-binding transcriptional LysR family regulator [Spinactinospora alkalitolerans]|uniref:DNA-binding transcriptional LysR family regulator n=1 Tax=Spinactinospora alkalitolerans TaxID=687207 RepID=A0A852U279_9ACTN|nr:LysR substrate-binding domain-containing protein [Spinactinospora alkalitolerans]NYE48254.1 DNA-binding transcriptional LysR family regulator [Spinactinospora alkalitolerans]
MDLTRLRLLVELGRLGTMAAVSEVTGMGTSAISKHFAVLEKEAGVRLLVPDGRRVRLTPAGHRLVEHAVGILARVEAAQAEMAGESEPAGRVDLVTFISVAPPIVLPALRRLREEHPRVDVRLIEHEPDQALELLQTGAADVGLVYEYSLVPRRFPDTLALHRIGAEPLLLAQPSTASSGGRAMTAERLRELSDASWIANSRGSDEDELVQRMCATAGFAPRIRHRIDNLDVVTSVVAAGRGVGVMPKLAAARRRGVTHTPLGDIGGVRRIYLVSRTGGWSWRPIRAVGQHLRDAARAVLDDVDETPLAASDERG